MNTSHLSNHVEIQTVKKSSVNEVESSTNILLTYTYVQFLYSNVWRAWQKANSPAWYTAYYIHTTKKYVYALVYHFAKPFILNGYIHVCPKTNQNSIHVGEHKEEKQFYPRMREWFMGFAMCSETVLRGCCKVLPTPTRAVVPWA